MATSTGLLWLFLCLFPAVILGETCGEPSVVSQIYTSNDAVLSTDTVFIVEFQLTCETGRNDINLYAHVNGATLMVTKGYGGAFQVTLSGTHKELPSGGYSIQFYDEEGYAVVRKAQRVGESTSTVTPLFNIDFHHRGVWTGPMVQSEVIAVGMATVVWYLAYSARSKLQS